MEGGKEERVGREGPTRSYRPVSTLRMQAAGGGQGRFVVTGILGRAFCFSCLGGGGAGQQTGSRTGNMRRTGKLTAAGVRKYRNLRSWKTSSPEGSHTDMWR